MIAGLTLATQILLGLVLGIATGLFLGEPAGALGIVGDAFIKLLQMTVLPYVVASLIAGLGSLEYREGRRLMLRVGALLVLLWVLAFGLVVAMPLAFPELQSASFFSTTLVERAPPIDFVGLYIPQNPFHSMANNLIPAVVLFSIAVGVALMGMADKRRLIDPLHTLGEALSRVSRFVVKLTPVGVFAIGASAAGTMTIEEFERVRVYIVAYIAFALLLTFWVLPGLVTALTPFRFRDVASLTRGALLTAFATGNEFVVLPLLAERSKEMLRERKLGGEETDSLVDVITPVAYTFPHVGKVLSLSFIPFAAWFTDSYLSAWEYSTLGLTGIVSVFGNINAAMLFLLDLMRIPQDHFQLFVATGVLNARFGSLVAAMHILVLTLLGVCALTGSLRPHWTRMIRYATGTVVLVAALVLGGRLAFSAWIDTTYRKGEILGEMQLLRDAVPVVVHREPVPPPPLDPGQIRLESIVERGSLRVCYYAEGRLPFTFFNQRGELVGFDVEMAHSLARGLGVTLEFAPVEGTFRGRRMARALNSGYCDIVMSRTILSMAQAALVDYSRPIMDTTAGFMVRDHRRSEFSDRLSVERRDDLRLAVPNDPYMINRAQRILPRAEVVPVESVREFLDADEGEYDAMVYAAEVLSAWSLLRPEFAVAVPQPQYSSAPMAYPLPLGEDDWADAVDAWIALKMSDGTIQQLYDYWILGREAERRGPRWSVVRNVLGWMD